MFAEIKFLCKLQITKLLKVFIFMSQLYINHVIEPIVKP